LEALSLGARGVLILGCLKERCHYGEGIVKAENKTGVLKKILPDFGIPQDSVQVMGVSGTMIEEFISTAWSMAKLVGSKQDE
jgi:coenzyme F420-reducing hydrogenase delta subunit